VRHTGDGGQAADLGSALPGRDEVPGDSIPRPVAEVSPWRLLVVTIAAVALAEVVAHGLVGDGWTSEGPQAFLVELLLMMGFVFPILYLLTFRPLLRQVAERRRAEAALRSANESLDRRVAQRTAELAALNLKMRDEFTERMAAKAALGAERERVEESLRVALEKYRVLFESFPLGITVSDASGQIVETNREAERLLGVPQHEMSQRGIGDEEWQIIRSDGSSMPADEWASVRALRENRLIENVEMGVVKGRGLVSWINVTAAPIPLPGYGVAIAYGDVTARKAAEEALRTSEEKLRALYASMTEGVALHEVVYDSQGRAVDYVIQDVNPAFEQITGLQGDQVVGRTASSAYGIDEPPFLDLYSRVAESGEPITFEVFFPPMGKHFRISVFSPEKGSFATVFEDITQRRQAESELRETRDYLEKLFSYANAPIIVWDPEFRITRFNAAFERLTGLKADEVRGQHIEILFPPERKEEAMAHIRRAGAGERWESVEISIRHVDGAVRTVLWNSATIHSDDGATAVATIAQGQDITLRKLAEDQVAASLREKELLLKEIHHRVKNNLQIVASMLSLQAERLSEERDLEPLRQSQERIRSMALVHEKVYRSRDLSRVGFREYIEDLVSHLLRSYRVGPGEISLRLVAEDVYLGIDAAIPVALIVNELVANSLKHGFPGGRDGELAIELSRDSSGGFLLVVADNGVGMPADLDFRSTDSLGLQIVSILTSQIGGTIKLDRGPGARFEIAFSEANS